MKPMVDCAAGGWWPPGCGVVSQANDNFASSITSYISGVLESMASWMWSFISGSFGVSNIDPREWTIVSGLTNWWVVVMMTPLVIVMIIQLISGLISQQPRRIGRALLGGALAVPLVFLATGMMSKLSSFTDSASTALLDTLGKDPFQVFMQLFGFQRAPAGSGREWDVVSLSVGADGGLATGVVVTAIAVLIVWILSFILMCSMIFRSFALIVLAAVAPVAIMLIPWERSRSWARVWCETVVALLIAKPLAATVLAVAVKLFANSSSFGGLASGAVGMMLACGAPLMALKLVSFAGGEIAGAAQMAGGGHVFSRAGNFTGRQLGRQFGGKVPFPGIGKRGPAPVPSTNPEAAAIKPSDSSIARGPAVDEKTPVISNGGKRTSGGGSEPPKSTSSNAATQHGAVTTTAAPRSSTEQASTEQSRSASPSGGPVRRPSVQPAPPPTSTPRANPPSGPAPAPPTRIPPQRTPHIGDDHHE